MKNKIILLSSVALALGACTPTVTERGNMLETYQLTKVVPGSSTKSDVLHILGSPTTQAPFDETTWYYMGQEMQKKGIFDPKVTKEKVVAVKFAEDGTVQSIRELPRGSRIDVPISQSKTVTHGSEMTLMQQFMGNLGKFNKTGDGKDVHAGR